MRQLKSKGHPILVTRLDEEKARAVRRLFRKSQYYPRSKVLTLSDHPVEIIGKGTILVITAGTTDIPVAEEAGVTAQLMGNRVETLYDVGVAGIHRLLSERERLEAARVLIVVAGMEGALPSVVGGLVNRPVIAVPTSIGYGTSFGGVTALLAMLNSCASGVAVVNIDNGFGAGYMASLINRE
jgi:NCAIR mutase (PurE)-related protein